MAKYLILSVLLLTVALVNGKITLFSIAEVDALVQQAIEDYRNLVSSKRAEATTNWLQTINQLSRQSSDYSTIIQKSLTADVTVVQNVIKDLQDIVNNEININIFHCIHPANVRLNNAPLEVAVNYKKCAEHFLTQAEQIFQNNIDTFRNKTNHLVAYEDNRIDCNQNNTEERSCLLDLYSTVTRDENNYLREEQIHITAVNKTLQDLKIPLAYCRVKETISGNRNFTQELSNVLDCVDATIIPA